MMAEGMAKDEKSEDKFSGQRANKVLIRFLYMTMHSAPLTYL